MPRVYKVEVHLGQAYYGPDSMELRVTLWVDYTRQHHFIDYIPIDHMQATFDLCVQRAIYHLKQQVAKDELHARATTTDQDSASEGEQRLRQDDADEAAGGIING